MKFFGNKIDKLIAKQCRLIVKKQKVKDDVNADASVIETKLARLESKIATKRQIADYKVTEFDREIEKLAGQIELERIYAASGEPAQEKNKYKEACEANKKK